MSQSPSTSRTIFVWLSTIFIVVVVAGAIVSPYVLKQWRKYQNEVPVYIARHDIRVHTELTKDMSGVMRVPKKVVENDDFLRVPAKIDGRFARRSLHQGQWLKKRSVTEIINDYSDPYHTHLSIVKLITKQRTIRDAKSVDVYITVPKPGPSGKNKIKRRILRDVPFRFFVFDEENGYGNGFLYALLTDEQVAVLDKTSRKGPFNFLDSTLDNPDEIPVVVAEPKRKAKPAVDESWWPVVKIDGKPLLDDSLTRFFAIESFNSGDTMQPGNLVDVFQADVRTAENGKANESRRVVCKELTVTRVEKVNTDPRKVVVLLAGSLSQVKKLMLAEKRGPMQIKIIDPERAGQRKLIAHTETKADESTPHQISKTFSFRLPFSNRGLQQSLSSAVQYLHWLQNTFTTTGSNQ